MEAGTLLGSKNGGGIKTGQSNACRRLLVIVIYIHWETDRQPMGKEPLPLSERD